MLVGLEAVPEAAVVVLVEGELLQHVSGRAGLEMESEQGTIERPGPIMDELAGIRERLLCDDLHGDDSATWV